MRGFGLVTVRSLADDLVPTYDRHAMRGTHSIFAGSFGPVVALLLVSSPGCAGQRTALQKQVTGLEEEVTVLQNANDRLEERIAALELNQVTRSRPTEEASEPGRPKLKVVKLAPEPGVAPPPKAEPSPASSAEPAGGDPSPDPPRPLIHGTGERLETKMPEGPTSALQPGAWRRDARRSVGYDESRVGRARA